MQLIDKINEILNKQSLNDKQIYLKEGIWYFDIRVLNALNHFIILNYCRKNQLLNAKFQYKFIVKNKNIEQREFIEYFETWLTFFSKKPKNQFIYEQIKNIIFENKTFLIKYESKFELIQIKDYLKSFIKCLLWLGFNEPFLKFEEKNTESILEFRKKTLNKIKKETPLNVVNKNPVVNIKKNSKQNLQNKTFNKIKDIDSYYNNVVIHGKIFDTNTIITKNNNAILVCYITDFSESISCKVFINDAKDLQKYNDLKSIGNWVSILGDISWDDYAKDKVVKIKKFQLLNTPNQYKQDKNIKPRSELHIHTKMSSMDGVGDIEEYYKKASLLGDKAIAFTDHLNIQSFPSIFNISKKYPNIKTIYGCEFNVLESEVKYAWNSKKQNLENSKYVIFDLETTGLNPEFNEIIEFGAVVVDGILGSSKKYNFLIKPKQKVNSFITNLTGITNNMLSNQDTIDKILPKIKDIFKDAILVAHNANFDIDFLDYWFQQYGYEKINNSIIDTMQVSRALIDKSKNYRLGTLCKKFNIDYDVSIAHRADYDANVLYRLYIELQNIMKNKFNIKYDNEISKIHTDEIYKKLRPFHINILAKNQDGLKALMKLVSISHTDTFFKKPLLFKKDITKLRKNLLIGGGCQNSEIFDIAKTKPQYFVDNILEFYDYVELLPLDYYKNILNNNNLLKQDLISIQLNIINSANKLNKNIIATSNPHYVNKEDQEYRSVYINNKGIGGKPHPLFQYNNANLFYPEQHYYSGNELVKGFLHLKIDNINEIIYDNTNKISSQIKPINIIKKDLYTPFIEGVNDELKKLAYKNLYKKYSNKPPQLVIERLDKELDSVIKHGFSVIYWISYELVKDSFNNGYLVGSRGSVGSSFLATILNITEVNPLQPHYLCSSCGYSNFDVPKSILSGYDLEPKDCPKCSMKLFGDGHNIPFETFLGFNADKVPDIDLNFSGIYQPKAHEFVKKMFGEKHTFRAGTISTVANRTAFGYVKNYLEIIQDENRSKADIQRLVKGCEGVKRTTGQHPGGIIVIPKKYDVEDFTPFNYPADDDSSNWYTTHFDFHAIHDNVLKLDILGHDDPTALKMLENLTKIDPQKIPTKDEKVMSLFISNKNLGINNPDNQIEKTGAIGIPEFGTTFVRKMLTDTKPKTFADLVQISGLSHGTNVWTNNAQDIIKNKIASLSELIGCRDDIMIKLIKHDMDKKLSFNIMENVRKGKGLTKEEIVLMKEHNIPNWYIESCNKIKYMFPKAHATAYVLMAWRIAWFKIYYPLEYYATYYSTRIDIFDLKTALSDSREIYNKVKTFKGLSKIAKNKLSNKEKELIPIFEVILEMKNRGFDFKNVDINKSQATEFIIDQDEDGIKYIIPPFITIDSLGVAVAESIIKARDIKPIKSIEDLKKRTNVSKNHIKFFQENNILIKESEINQISIFDF